MLNKVQKVAFQFIQSDARFLYTLVDMQEGPIFELEISASLCLAEILKLIVHIHRSNKLNLIQI